MSNLSRLVDAGIIDEETTRSQEQNDAIASLTETEVDSLISSQDKLFPEIHDEDGIVRYPGIPRRPKN